jgi:seryl-tRNA synthetase
MYRDMENNTEEAKTTTYGIRFLEQTFNQLPAEGKETLKKFLQSVVAIQNTVKSTVSVGKIQSSINE